MTLEATIDRPAAEPAGMPWPPAGQKARTAVESRVERLTAELERQRDHMHGACMMAEELRGLSLLFKAVFCDDEIYSGGHEIVSERTAAAWVVVNCLGSMAGRLDGFEDLADTSRIHALAEVAR